MEAKRTNSVHLDGLLEHQEDLEPTLSSLKLQPSTTAIHADGHLNHSTDVAPPVHVSTIFRYTSDPDALITAAGAEVRCQITLASSFAPLPGSTVNGTR